MLYLVAPLWIFSPRIWQDVQLWGSCACANKIPKQQYLWTWCQSVVPNDAPRDFGPEVAFGAKFQMPVARQGGREMSAPRPYVTDPFRPLSSINSWKQFLYIQQHSSYFLHVVRSSVSRSGAHLTTADALLKQQSCLRSISIISLVFFHMVRPGAYWHKTHYIHACVFTLQTKKSFISFRFLFRGLL